MAAYVLLTGNYRHMGAATGCLARRGRRGDAGLGITRCVLVAPRMVISGWRGRFCDWGQAAVAVGSIGVRVTFMPGLSRSISRILDRVRRPGFWEL